MERDVFIQPNHLISEEAKMYCNTLRDFVDKPSQFTVCPNTAYDSVLTITTALYVTPGDYWFRLEQYLEDGYRGSGWIRISVTH